LRREFPQHLALSLGELGHVDCRGLL
jgi:hypothetical protein